jgi:sugar-specific transcriptional regulator TrmB
MTTNIIKTTLTELDCSDFEIQLYEILSKHKMGVSDLAKHFDVHREKIYITLASLEKKGIIQKSESYSRSINISPPNYLLTLLKLKVSKTNRTAQELSTAMPELLLGFEQKNKPEWVESATDESEFLNLYDNFIKECKTNIVCFCNPMVLNEVIDFSFLKYWTKNRQSKNLKIRILIPKEYIYLYEQDHELTSNKSFLREIKSFESIQPFQGTFYISGSLVIFYDTIALKAIKIDNYVMANTLLALFELEWARLS